jgi:hypothetical protein
MTLLQYNVADCNWIASKFAWNFSKFNSKSFFYKKVYKNGTIKYFMVCKIVNCMPILHLENDVEY